MTTTPHEQGPTPADHAHAAELYAVTRLTLPRCSTPATRAWERRVGYLVRVGLARGRLVGHRR